MLATVPVGRFLVLEGLDGVGKSTLTRGLADWLAANDPAVPVLLTYEPRNEFAAGMYIRAVLAREFSIAPRTLALAYALNRADHTERLITPHLHAGGVVICDRYVLSSLAYNTGPDCTADQVFDLNAAARKPDLTLFLNASAETCYQRLGQRGGPRELFDTKLEERRARYADAIAYLRRHDQRIVEIAADGSPAETLAAALAALRN